MDSHPVLPRTPILAFTVDKTMADKGKKRKACSDTYIKNVAGDLRQFADHLTDKVDELSQTIRVLRAGLQSLADVVEAMPRSSMKSRSGSAYLKRVRASSRRGSSSSISRMSRIGKRSIKSTKQE